MCRTKGVFILSLVVGLSVLVLAGVGCAPEAAPPPPPPPAPAAPASFQVAELAIDPAGVAPGEKVTITARVTNSGGTEGSYAAELKINDVTEATSTVNVAAGAGRTWNFRSDH